MRCTYLHFIAINYACRIVRRGLNSFLRYLQLIPNLYLTSVTADSSSVSCQGTRASYTSDADGSHAALRMPDTETKFSLLGNFFLSEGRSGGKVLEVRCSSRKEGGDNLVSALRRTLLDAFPSSSVGLGGTFVVKRGRVKIHVMPEYSSCPLQSDGDVENWLKFYEVDAGKSPFVCMSTSISQDPVFYYYYLGYFWLGPSMFCKLSLLLQQKKPFY